MAKAKTKPKTEKKPDPAPATAPAPAPKKRTIDLSHLGEKGAKRTELFLEKASAKRHVDDDKILAACLHYCATLSQRRHGIHYVLQMIEQVTRCKIR